MKNLFLVICFGMLFISQTSGQLIPELLDWDGLGYNLEGLPHKLSASGFDPSNSEVWVPYDVNVPQYQSLMYAKRYVSVPENQKITVGDSLYYSFPKGTVLVKALFLDTVLNDSSTRKPVELQMMIRVTDSTWGFVCYNYGADLTDADMVVGSYFTEKDYYVEFNDIPMAYQDTTQPGVPATGASIEHFRMMWDCAKCHKDPATNGFFTQQLNMGTQLQDLVTAGVLESAPDLEAMETEGKVTRWAPMDDADATEEEKVRSYMAGNCSYCHNDLEVWADWGGTTEFNYWTQSDDISWVAADSGPIIPGNPAESDIIIRMREMIDPPSDVSLPDVHAIQMVWDWTNSLNPPGVPWEDVHITKTVPPTKKNLRGTIHAAFNGQILRLTREGAVSKSVQLFTLEGREVKLHQMNGDTYMVSRKLTPGLYFLRSGSFTKAVQFVNY